MAAVEGYRICSSDIWARCVCRPTRTYWLLFFFFCRSWDLTTFSIYAVRAIANKGFEYQISKTQKYLEGLNKQRQVTIEKLKVATKYNSTQQLLEKYGGETSPQKNTNANSKRSETDGRVSGTPRTQQMTGRTGIAPPPTANIRRNQDGSAPTTPAQSPQPLPDSRTDLQPPLANAGGRQSLSPQDVDIGFDEPGFAPNAFPAPPQYSESQHRWYDRLLDVLLGEDETLPRNRLVLICQNCRLVNGQTPPGIKTLEEIGRWRCGSCGAWNGEESEAKKMLADIKKSQTVRSESEKTENNPDAFMGHHEDGASSEEVVAEEEHNLSESEDEEQQEPEPEPEPESSTTKNKRGRPKGSRKKG
jgi:hypothetical protein